MVDSINSGVSSSTAVNGGGVLHPGRAGQDRERYDRRRDYGQLPQRDQPDERQRDGAFGATHVDQRACPTLEMPARISTTATMVKDNVGDEAVTNVGGTLYFTAGNSTIGYTLYKSDGTSWAPARSRW